MHSPEAKTAPKKKTAAPDREEVRAFAQSIGFDVVRFSRADTSAASKKAFADFVAEGLHGDMNWLAETAERRADPKVLWPEARTAIMLGLNYGPKTDPLKLLEHPERGVVSVYARNRDYHDVLKKRLKRLAGWLHERTGAGVKVFVDTAPVLEKPLAQQAGIGWQGKHTNVVSREFGSWLFLGEVFTTLDFAPDEAEADHCGACSRCLDICPTRAFVGPYKLDARRCISYLTIEHKGPIPRELRPLMGNHIYGCDDCLSVCPWNKFAQATQEADFLPRVELTAPTLKDLAQMDDAAFRAVFTASPVKRVGRDRFIRNVLIAIGNSGLAELIEVTKARLDDASPLVRGAAVWALRRLCGDAEIAALRENALTAEADESVREEWRLPL